MKLTKDEILQNATMHAQYLHLYIYFADNHIEKHLVNRFTDLSQTHSKYYYYEEPNDEWGKGKKFHRDEILCFEVSPWPLQNWEQHLAKEQRDGK